MPLQLPKDFRFATSPWGFRELPMSTQIQMMQDLGLSYYPMQMIDQDFEGLLDLHPSDSVLQSAQALLDQANMKVSSWNVGGEYMAPEDQVADQIAETKRHIDIAAPFKPEIIVLFAGWTSRCDDAVYDQVGRCLQEVCEYAQQYDMTIAMENHGGITTTVEQIHRITKSVTAKNFGLNYDPANFEFYGVDPLESLKRLEIPVVFTHFKSVKKNQAGEKAYCRLREGYIDYQPIVQKLLDMNYQGFWTLEYEEPSDAFEGSRDDLEDLIGYLNQAQSPASSAK